MHDLISELKGLDPAVQAKLEINGIRAAEQLLEHTQTGKKRTELGSSAGVTPTLA